MKSGRRLYEYILTRSHLLGSPLRAAPNLTVTAVYPRLSRALVLPEEDFELESSIHLPSRPPQVISVKYAGLILYTAQKKSAIEFQRDQLY